MADYDSPGDVLPGRTANFEQGMSGGGPVASSLEAASERFNSQVGGFTPMSVLDAYQVAGFHPNNGNSATDAGRQTPAGPIATTNGYSQRTYDALNPSYKTRLAP